MPIPSFSGLTDGSVMVDAVGTAIEGAEVEVEVEEKGKDENDGTVVAPSTVCACVCPCVCACVCVCVSVCVSAISLTLVSYAALTDLSIISRRRPSMLRRCSALLALPP